MKAIVLEAFGGPEALKLQDLALPSLMPDEVMVAVRASGICHHDVMHRAGKLPGAKVGVVLGHETAGEIVQVGADVRDRKVGDRVVIYQRRFCGTCRHCLSGRQDMCRSSTLPGVDTEGGYAERVAVPAVSTVLVPEGLSWAAAALASCPIATSWRALSVVAGVRPGDTVLVTGASGGLGVHQLQLIRAMGATSIAVTSSPAKAERLRELGAHHVVVATDLDYSAEVWRLTGKQGVNAAMENVGPTLPQTLRCMGQGATAVVLGNIGARDIAVSPGLLIGRRLTVAGSGSASFEDIRQVLAMLKSGLIEPVIAATLPFSKAHEGHALMDDQQLIGRVVMQDWA